MSKCLTTEEFIKKSKLIHGNKYNYSKVIYSNYTTDVLIICNQCSNVFSKTPKIHLNKLSVCPSCSKRKRLTTKEFIKKSIEIHGDKYDYSEAIYINNKTHLVVICRTCFDNFLVTPNMHLQQKCGCPYCNGNNRLTKDTFISTFNHIHGYNFSFDKLIIGTSNDKIILTCHKHGDYISTQKKSLYLKNGCPMCKESKGEKKIRLFLDKQNIPYIREYIIKKLGNYRFDFYIKKYNLIIEYDGKQHFQPISFFGGLDALRKVKYNDYIKTMYCLNNSINIIRIKYTDYDKIEKILNKYIKEYYETI